MSHFRSWDSRSLLPGEDILLEEHNVSVADEHGKVELAGGVLSVTTRRLLWLGSVAVQLDLASVDQATVPTGFLKAFSASHIVLSLKSAHVQRLQFHGKIDLTVVQSILQSACSALQVAPALEETVKLIGIRGVMQRQENDLKKGEADIQNAFSDLKSLMAKAKEMVALVDVYSARLRARGEGGDTSGEEELARMAMRMGMQVPANSRGDGQEDLARELARCLTPLVERCGGMLVLQDAYCLANRARGTVLLSPQDMVQACALFERLALPLRFVELPSGVKVIQTAAYSTDEVAAAVRTLLASRPFLSASDLAVARGHSVALCSEQLLELERVGVLCRDDTEHGLLFFENRFNSAA